MNAAGLCSVLLACWMASLCLSKEVSTGKQGSANDLSVPVKKEVLRPVPKMQNRPATAEDLMPQEVKDGVLVLGGEELKTVKAHWVILVTLQAPVYPEGLRAVLNAL